jgi:transcriptional regulator with XRE-family HTH domain
MSKVENGRMVPSLDVLGRLSRALGLDDATSYEVRELLAAVEGASDWEATLDAAKVRRAFCQALKGIAGINADEWTPRELRHSFVPCCPTVAFRWK